MNWVQLVECFFAGVFLANFVPHFVNGVSGDPFPTPFAKPPGRGLSSPVVNVAWALLNLVVGYWLFRRGQVGEGGSLRLGIFFVGIAAISLQMSLHFEKKYSR